MSTRHWAGRDTSGRVLIEYAVLVIIILTALYWMKPQIQRALYGHWKTTGDSFAFGRQYDPKGTVACTRDTGTNVWYDERCFDSQRNTCDKLTNDNAAAECEKNIIQGCAANCGKPNGDQF